MEQAKTRKQKTPKHQPKTEREIHKTGNLKMRLFIKQSFTNAQKREAMGFMLVT
jgi:hypothetical protein